MNNGHRVKETTIEMIEFLMSLLVVIDDPEYSLTIVPTNEVRVRVKEKIIVLQEGTSVIQ